MPEGGDDRAAVNKQLEKLKKLQQDLFGLERVLKVEQMTKTLLIEKLKARIANDVNRENLIKKLEKEENESIKFEAEEWLFLKIAVNALLYTSPSFIVGYSHKKNENVVDKDRGASAATLRENSIQLNLLNDIEAQIKGREISRNELNRFLGKEEQKKDKVDQNNITAAWLEIKSAPSDRDVVPEEESFNKKLCGIALFLQFCVLKPKGKLFLQGTWDQDTLKQVIECCYLTEPPRSFAIENIILVGRDFNDPGVEVKNMEEIEHIRSASLKLDAEKPERRTSIMPSDFTLEAGRINALDSLNENQKAFISVLCFDGDGENSSKAHFESMVERLSYLDTKESKKNVSQLLKLVDQLHVSHGNYNVVKLLLFPLRKIKKLEEKPEEEKPVKEKPVKEKPVKEKPEEEKPVKEKPEEEKPVKEKPEKNDDKKIKEISIILEGYIKTLIAYTAAEKYSFSMFNNKERKHHKAATLLLKSLRDSKEIIDDSFANALSKASALTEINTAFGTAIDDIQKTPGGEWMNDILKKGKELIGRPSFKSVVQSYYNEKEKTIDSYLSELKTGEENQKKRMKLK